MHGGIDEENVNFSSNFLRQNVNFTKFLSNLACMYVRVDFRIFYDVPSQLGILKYFVKIVEIIIMTTGSCITSKTPKTLFKSWFEEIIFWSLLWQKSNLSRKLLNSWILQNFSLFHTFNNFVTSTVLLLHYKLFSWNFFSEYVLHFSTLRPAWKMICETNSEILSNSILWKQQFC